MSSKRSVPKAQVKDQIPAEWICWIDENINRGVLQQTLIDTLIQNNFNREVAIQTVTIRAVSFMPNVSSAAANAVAIEHYQYEKIGPKADNTIQTADREIRVLMTMEKPKIVLFENVLSNDECKQLIALSKPKLDRSTIVDDFSGNQAPHKDRTSNGTYFQRNETPFIAKLDKRIAELMRVPVENGEGIQILNYKTGGEYKPHYDYFPPELAGSKVHIARGGQRVATLIMYLNTVDGGGETIFPELDLKVSAVQGNAIYFAYTNSRSQVDPLTYHGGNPVVNGEKWIATKWMRQNEYR
ncbi:MAG: 2OG-Fe(II) oxygenase [Pseudomonadota bacterium]